MGSAQKDAPMSDTRLQDSRESNTLNHAVHATSSLEAALSTLSKTSSHVTSEMGKMNGLVRQWLEYLKGTPEGAYSPLIQKITFF